MVGTSNLQENSITIDDSTSGNGNGVINSNECVNLDIALKNNGCANATGISATLTTDTSGVTVTQGSSSYPNMPIDAVRTNSTPFQIQTSADFACGTEIDIVQEGIPAVIPVEFCYVGWQESLSLLAHVVEPEIPDGP